MRGHVVLIGLAVAVLLSGYAQGASNGACLDANAALDYFRAPGVEPTQGLAIIAFFEARLSALEQDAERDPAMACRILDVTREAIDADTAGAFGIASMHAQALRDLRGDMGSNPEGLAAGREAARSVGAALEGHARATQATPGRIGILAAALGLYEDYDLLEADATGFWLDSEKTAWTHAREKAEQGLAEAIAIQGELPTRRGFLVLASVPVAVDKLRVADRVLADHGVDPAAYVGDLRAARSALLDARVGALLDTLGLAAILNAAAIVLATAARFAFMRIEEDLVVFETPALLEVDRNASFLEDWT